jgi:rhodanese-related sulfurtransferase
MSDRTRAFLASILVGLALACGERSTAADAKRVPPEQAKVIIDGRQAFLLDVRTEAEFLDRHIPGTDALIPVQELPQRMKELESLKTKPILIYCRSGNRSLQAAELLQKNGFQVVTDLQGGLQAWAAKGYPTATGPFVPRKGP